MLGIIKTCFTSAFAYPRYSVALRPKHELVGRLELLQKTHVVF